MRNLIATLACLLNVAGCSTASLKTVPLTFPTYREAAQAYGETAENEARCVKLFDRADHERLEDARPAGSVESAFDWCADNGQGFQGSTCSEARELACDWLE